MPEPQVQSPSPAGYQPDVVREYTEAGYWGDTTVSTLVSANAHRSPQGTAFVADDGELTWADYHSASVELAAQLAAGGVGRGSLVAVLLPDLATTHVVYLALEKAGAVVVGLGPRSGAHEVEHLLRLTAAPVLLAPRRVHDLDVPALFTDIAGRVASLRRLIVVEPGPRPTLQDAAGAPLPRPAGATVPSPIDADEVFLLNSTSGTTGLPKCVEHNQNRWMHFARLAIDAGDLGPSDVVLSALPTPFGFGLWTTHFTPAVVGIATVLISKWEAHRAAELMVEHGVTVFAGVTTQLMMLLDVLEREHLDLPDLRVVFTGGEAVPFERASRFEELARCAVLQFYGSNESGALSRTTVRDTRDQRLRTAGRVIPEMHVRLVDPGTDEPVAAGEPGLPTCRGPLVSSGYFNDDEANRALVGPEGRLRMPDLATIDDDGYLRVVGRVADIIIRGGMNISALDVEAAVAGHPAVEQVAVVGMPDPTFGERVCAFVVAGPGRPLDLPTLQAHLRGLGMTRHTWPERLELLDALPISAGEKVAKAELRRMAAALTD